MVADGDRSGSRTVAGGERFALERFAWTAPDRLEVAGTFEELRESPSGNPALAVRGTGGWRQLLAVSEDAGSTPRAGEPWRATFAWEDVPTPFDAAQLTFGDDLYVRLPEPADQSQRGSTTVLDVVRVGGRGGDGDGDGEADPPSAEATDPAAEEADAGSGAPSVRAQVEHVRLQARLRAAQERIGELEATRERLAAELERTRGDLEGERERRAADAQQFEEGLTQVREMAEHSIAETRGEIERQAQELGELRGRIEAEAADRQQRDDEAAALRARVAALDRVQALADEARASTRGALDRLEAMNEELDGQGG